MVSSSLKGMSSAQKVEEKSLPFSPQAAVQRLRKLQFMLKNYPRRRSSRSNDICHPDSLLVVPGVDGNYNPGSRGIINYLFMGRSGDYINHYSFDENEDRFDDIVLLVLPDRVYIYCNPKNYSLLMPYLALWKNCRVFCLNEEKFDDSEYAEEYKIKCFIEMMSDSSVVAMALDGASTDGKRLTSAKSFGIVSGKKNENDPYEVEKWPLIQAYALEDFGTQGFFTMKHTVINASEIINDVYSTLDVEDVKYAVKTSLCRFEHHWQTMLANVDVMSTTNKLGELKESNVSEPLFSYYRYGQMGFKGDVSGHGLPRVFFGIHSNTKRNDEIMSPDGSKLLKDCEVSTAGNVEGTRQALQMTCEASEPRGPLKCARTYFFAPAYAPSSKDKLSELVDMSHGVNIHRLIDEKENELNSLTKDSIQLKNLYETMIECVNQAILMYVDTLCDVYEINQFLVKKLKHCAQERGLLPPSFDFSKDSMEFTILGYNSVGKPVSLVGGKAVMAAKYARLSLLNIPSMQSPLLNLGALVYGDTFLDARIELLTQASVDNEDLYRSQVVLTSSVPLFITWTNFSSYISIFSALKTELFPSEKLITSLSNSSQNMVLSSKHSLAKAVKAESEMSKCYGRMLLEDERFNVSEAILNKEMVEKLNSFINVTNCHLTVYEKAIVLEEKRAGLFIVELEKESVKSLFWYDGGSTDKIATFTIQFESSYKKHLPVSFQNRASTITMCFLPQTRTRRIFNREVLGIWEKMETLENKLKSFVNDENVESDVKMEYDEMQSYAECLRGGSRPGSTASSLTDLSSSTSNVNWEAAKHVEQGFCLKGYREVLSILELKDAHSHLPRIPACSWDAISHCLQGQASTNWVDENRAGMIPITIISGIPGSGKSRLCASIVNVSTENTKWVVVEQSIESGIEFNAAKTQKAMSSIWKNVSKTEGAKKKQTRVVVITPGYSDIVEVSRGIVNHPDVDVRSHFFIGAITTCVDPSLVFMNDREVYPAVLEQCSSGFCSNAVFTKCDNIAPSKLNRVQEMLKACNSKLSFVRTKNKYNLVSQADFDIILSTDMFNSNEMEIQRLMLHAGWNSIDEGYNEPNVVSPFKSVVLTFNGLLEKPLLTTQLKGLMSANLGAPVESSKRHSGQGMIHRLKGRVLLSENNEEVEVQFNRANRVYNLHNTGNDPKVKGSKHSKDSKSNCCVVFVGENIEEQACKNWLRKCQKPLPQKKSLKTRADMRQSEIKNIQKKHMGDPLPDGFFFNGSQYVSFDGQRLDMHPYIEKFIDEYLDDYNTKAVQFNADIEAQSPVDLFHH